MTYSPLHLSGQQTPDAIALVEGGISHSYQAVSRQVLALGAELRALGLQRGDKLACVAANCRELMLLYWACLDLGLLFCPLSPKFPDSQLQELLERFHIRFIWCPDNARNELWQTRDITLVQADFATLDSTRLDLNSPSTEIATVSADTPLNIILTSGSSGSPKAAVHSLNNHIANANGSRQLIPLTSGDAWLLSLPLFHIGGLAILNRCALAAAAVVLPDNKLTMAAQLRRDAITHLSLVATQLQRLLDDSPESLMGVKCLLLGGGAIGQGLLDRLSPLKVKAFTSYGMTEMGSQITTGMARSDGSSGRLLPRRELKIEQGVIWVRGETLFMGYLQPDGSIVKETQDGWFCTKDKGFWSHDGLLHIQGRLDNMFICGGENIQPEEVEAALKRHPAIMDAIVFGEDNPEFGLLPAAILQYRSIEVPSEAELTAFLADKLARFKRPRHYYPWPQVVADGLKVQRKQLIAAVSSAAKH
ncbi:o-succinylbenzoate--CoA ligase [Shewanella sp. K8]|uniref:O-succinylbenzoate--CoA ligase n=1 Tax=bacterium 19CA01SA08 TaxID=2920574 RepID=A0AAU6VUH1_UNCXX|nr:o-succinylbenzoate--CoA ligase [Shewanella sp. K8]MDE0565114.1 o-succinylbenzoate--CoA ligase [Shewanella sp. K8]